MSDWVTEFMQSLPADAVRVCPTCQGTPEATPCRRCNDFGRVRARTPKLPKALCGTCGGYVRFDDRRAEVCPTCQGALPRWTPGYR